MMAKKTYRMEFKFWLDSMRHDESLLIHEINLLKASRSFSRTVREGIRLIVSLRRGELDVLFELFPWVKTALKESPKSAEVTRSAILGDDQLNLLADRLQYRLLQGGGVPTPRPKQTVEVEAGDLLELKTAKSDGKSAQNFIDKLYGLQGWSNPPKVADDKSSAETETKQKTSGGPKAMQVPQIAPPSFDDLMLD